MNEMQADLVEFHRKFGCTINQAPTIPDEKTKELRKKLIEEEVKELFEGIDTDNLVEIADGIADVLYVVLGTAVSYGIDIAPIFREVHRSNMSKVWPDGTVHYNEFGKVIKPPTYSKADILPLLYPYMENAQ